MTREIIAERLRALASDDGKRSKAARFRDVLGDVETALAAGVTRSVIIEELAKHGLEMTLATFATTLKREREKHKLTAAKNRIETDTKTAPKTPVSRNEKSTESEAVKVVESSTNPADIDKIIGTKPDLEALAKHAKRNKQ